MKKIFLMLVIVFAFGMNANAQDYAMADNSYNLVNNSGSKETSLSKTNKANFIKYHGKKAKQISKKFVNGKMIALKRGYTYKGNFHWLIMTIDSSKKYNVYAFTSKSDFESIKYKEVDKKINLRNYILENY